MKTKCAYGLLMAAMMAGPIHAEELICSEAQGSDQISALDFETFEPGTSLLGQSIVLDGEVTVNGSIVTGGDVEATGMVCGAAGCIGDPMGATVQEALITYDVASGTNGGSAGAETTWNTRPLNTVAYDPRNLVVILSGNQILLDPGTYIVTSNQVFYSKLNWIRSVRARFRDVTNNTTVAVSMNGRLQLPSGSSGHPQAEIPSTVFTVESLSGFELQYWFSNAHPDGDALGLPSSSGEVERYAYVHLRKISP